MSEVFHQEPRLWSIAINAVREAKIAYGRADDPYSDDDSARVTAIFDLLHVQEKVDPQIEHFPLVKDVKVSDKVHKITSLLKDLPETLRPNEEEVAQTFQLNAANLPKAAKTLP